MRVTEADKRAAGWLKYEQYSDTGALYSNAELIAEAMQPEREAAEAIIDAATHFNSMECLVLTATDNRCGSCSACELHSAIKAYEEATK